MLYFFLRKEKCSTLPTREREEEEEEEEETKNEQIDEE